MGSDNSSDGVYGGFDVINIEDSYLIKFGDSSFNIKKLEWDSSILELDLYRINNVELHSEIDYAVVSNFMKFMKSKFKKISCLTFKVEATKTGLIQNFLRNDFVLAGLPIKLSMDLDNKITSTSNKDNIRLFKSQDIPLLSDIARNAFLNAYRYNDKNFDRDKVDNLYSEWIKNSCNGRADAVFVYEENNIPQGFIACNIRNEIGLIDLIAVSKNARGNGVGMNLVLNSLSWFKDRVDKVEVNTEAMNYASLRIYQKVGFKIVWVGLDMDYWFD